MAATAVRRLRRALARYVADASNVSRPDSILLLDHVGLSYHPELKPVDMLCPLYGNGSSFRTCIIGLSAQEDVMRGRRSRSACAAFSVP